MNMIGYDAMALGEGDLIKLGVDTLQKRIQEANFPILSANVVLAETGELLTQPYVIHEIGGHQIAIIGLTTSITIPKVEIRDPLESVRGVVAQLQNQADIIILLSHLGLGTNQQIAAEIPEIDLVISGGGKVAAQSPQLTADGRTIVHADKPTPGHAGRWVGVGTWSFDAQGRQVSYDWRNVALSPDIPSDPDMLSWAQAQ